MKKEKKKKDQNSKSLRKNKFCKDVKTVLEEIFFEKGLINPFGPVLIYIKMAAKYEDFDTSKIYGIGPKKKIRAITWTVERMIKKEEQTCKKGDKKQKAWIRLYSSDGGGATSFCFDETKLEDRFDHFLENPQNN